MKFPQLLTIKEASQALKVHPNTLRLWEKEGLITSYRIDGKRFKRYKKEDVLKLFEKKGKSVFSKAHEAEEASYQKLKPFRLVVEHSIDLVAFFDKEMRYQYVSPSHSYVLGYSPDDLIHHKLSEIVHPDDMPAILEEQRKSILGEPISPIEFRLKRKDGSWITADGMAHIIFEKGKAVVAVAVARDITQRKRLEENLAFLAEASNVLASSLDYQQTLLSVARLAAPRIADFCVIDMINERGGSELVAGWHQDPKKLEIGLEFRKKFPLDINAKGGAGVVLRTGKPLIYPTISQELVAKLARGNEYLRIVKKLHLTSQMTVPLKVRDKVIGAISFATTGSRLLTQSDLPFAEELAKRAALAIENARLFQQSQNAITAREDFMKMVSHELKTPVTSLKAYTQVMERELRKKGDTNMYMKVKKMDSQLTSMTRLITELLELSRSQIGKLEYHKKIFSIEDLVEDIIDEMQLTEEKRPIIMEGKINKKIYADRDRIGQVLINLISNAMKYSERKIIVRIQSNSQWVTISVQDFGIGIPKEHQEKVFEQFYQVSDATGKKFPGLGIGLYLSSEIVKNHGGSIWVESEKGKGSIFSFTLPLPKDRKVSKQRGS